MNSLTTKIVALQSLANIGLDIQFFNTLADKVLSDKGFTLNLNGKEPETDKRFVVSLAGHERKGAVLTHECIVNELIKYVYYNQELLQRPNYYIGAWVEDKGLLVLDVSEVFSYRFKESAIVDICKERSQRAYYDLYNKETVFVK